MAKRTVSVFISYSNEDDTYFRLFKSGLEGRMKKSTKYDWDIWTDHSILPGELWHEVIQDKVKGCHCAILLISNNFLASDYIEEHELRHFLERQEKEGLLLIPLELSPYRLESCTPLEQRQVFKPKGRDFGVPGLERISFADLIQFDVHGQPLNNPYRERYLDAFIEKIELTLHSKLPVIPARQHPSPLLFVPSVAPSTVTTGYTHAFVHGETYQQAYFELNQMKSNLGPATREHELARTSEFANKLTAMVFSEAVQLRDKIYDSVNLKRLYPNVHFDEILYQTDISPLTEQVILEKRRQRSRFPRHERSLIVSALTLRLLRRFEEKSIYHLLDFVREKEPFIWKKALTGIVLAYLEHEKEIPATSFRDLMSDLSLLKEDPVIQEALTEIEIALAVRRFEETIEKLKDKVRFDEKFEFFQKIQHWFLPFYPDNPVLNEHVSDRETRELILENQEWMPDALKYAFCLNYSRLTPDEKEDFLSQLRRSKENIRAQYLEWKSLHPGYSPLEVVQIHDEIKNHLTQVYFFRKYYSQETFGDMILTKINLYGSSLSGMIAHEQWKDKLWGLSLYGSGQSEKAIPYLERVVQREPAHYYYLSRLGRCYREAGEFDKAVECLGKARETGAGDIWVLAELSECFGNKLYANYNVDKALELREEIERLAPDVIWNLQSIASYLEIKNDFERALQYRQRVANLEPHDPTHIGNLGYALLNVGKVDEALSMRLKVEELAPDLTWNQIGLVQCYLKKAEYDKALHYCEKLAGLNAGNAETLKHVGGLYYEMKQYDKALNLRLQAESITPDDADNLSAIAYLHALLGDKDAAYAYCQKTLGTTTKNYQALYRAGFVLGELKKWAEALEVLQEAEKLMPDYDWNLLALAKTHENLGNTEQAYDYCRRILNAGTSEVYLMQSTGFILLRIKRPDEGLEIFQKLQAAHPADIDTLRGLAAYYLYYSKHDRESYKRAEDCYLKTIELDPTFASNWRELGETYFKLREYEKALDALRRSEELNPTDVNNLWNLSNVYKATGDYPKLLACSLKIVELQPENAAAWSHFGNACLLNGDMENAEAALEKADALSTLDLSQRLQSKGWAYFSAGFARQAGELFKRSIEEGYTHFNAFMNFGHTQLIEKNGEAALENYRKSFELAEDVEQLLRGFEDDFEHIGIHGVDPVRYRALVNEARRQAGK